MTSALMALVLALFSGTPVTVPMVEDAGAAVAVGAVRGGYGGWVGCSATHCDVEVADLGHLRHEACHVLDIRSDGKMDGEVAGLRMWAGDLEAETGDYANDAERFGYWCARQEIRP